MQMDGRLEVADIAAEYQAWLMRQRPCGTEPRTTSNGIAFDAEAACAEVNIYPFEEGQQMVELRVTHVTGGETAFFLHFVLEDLEHAQTLFREMEDALAAQATREPVKVLLCCTSAMTTTFFARKMQEVAHTLSLDYTFFAMSVGRVLEGGADEYKAILLAPQVGFQRHHIAHMYPNALVFEIPPKLFGGYDAAGVVRLLMHALHDDRDGQEATTLRPQRGVTDDYLILVITLFLLRHGARLGFRLYQGKEVLAEGSAKKAVFDFRDVDDLIETIGMRGLDLKRLDAIGIAVPGVTFEGMVNLPHVIGDDYDLGPHLEKHFGVPVFVDNNCNAAATGCYVSQDEFESLAFFRHEFGHQAGGLGTIHNGRLIRGYLSQAGEPKHIERRFSYGETSYDEARFSAEGMFRIAVNMCLACICVTGPEAIYLSVDTVDDMEALHRALAEVVSEEFVPVLVPVEDYVGTVYIGEVALCVHRLQSFEEDA
jgi:cellobiose-specific phosphotransferase system component IIB